MKKNELIAICKFLLRLCEKDNFKMYLDVTLFMYDYIVPLSDSELSVIPEGDFVPIWVTIFTELLDLVKSHLFIERSKKK